MGLKAKLLSCVAMFVFIVGIVVVGVLAASNADFLFQGDLNYNIADKSLYVKDVQYQHGMIGEPVTVPGFREGYINNGFELNIESAQIETNTVGTFVLYFDIINLIVDGQTHEYIASASWADTAVTGISFSIDTSSATIAKGTVTPENLNDSTPISGRVALEIRSTVNQTFDLSNIAVLFSQSVNVDEIDYVLNDDGSITINDYTGSGSNIVIPDSYTVGGVTYPITSVGSETFRNNTDIQTVTLPDGITSIGNSAFNSCSNLTNINLPEGLTEIGNNAFSACSKLSDIVLPDTLTTIGEMAFYNCQSISGTLNIPASVTSIGKSALSLQSLIEFTVDEDSDYFTAYNGVLYNKDMTRLLAYPRAKATTNFVMPKSVLTIDTSAFRYCQSMRGTFTLSPNLTTIGDSAFYDCAYVSGTLNIPASLTNIGTGAFGGAGFSAFQVASGNTAYMSDSGVLYNKTQSLLVNYPRNKADTSFAIPETVKSIGGNAFYNCKNLTTITLPSSLQTIGGFAFYGCNWTGDVVLPSTVTLIGNAVFGNTQITSISIDNDHYTTVDGVLYDAGVTTLIQYPAGSLRESFIIPNTVTSIRPYALTSAAALTSITIPSSVTSIGGTAFYRCSSLATVTVDSPTVAAMLSSKTAASYLINYATTVYVSDSAAPSLPSTFPFTLDTTGTQMPGYKKYTV